ncbi:MAG TPA: hypothetical protein VFH73_22285 [Polyangia bacterium]|nr:hypothetical protein [Polyangia bacterium]
MRRAVIVVSGCLTIIAGCTNSQSGPTGGAGGGGGSGTGGAATTGTGGVATTGTGGADTSGTGGSSSGGASGSGGAGLPTDGATDAGGTTLPDAAMPGGCAGLFCEDFESGQIDPGKWATPTANGGTFMLQQKIVAHGKYAVQFHGNPNLAQPDYAYLIWKNAPAAMAKHNFGRAYFYITPKPHDIDMGMIYGGTAGFPKPTYLSIANHSTGWQLGFIKLSGSPGGEVQAYPRPDIPVAVWTCLEWEFNDQPTSINVWVDGQVVGSLTNQKIDYPGGHVPGSPLYNGMNSDLIGAFTDFGIGYYDWHPQGRPAFDLYYDDIVLGTTRPGCLQ